jgi:hypothetical protein
MKPPSPNEPTFLFDDLELDWLMTRWEKYAFDAFLSWLQPGLALEVGTYRGGSLQVIAKHAARVISVDLIEGPKRELSSRFPHVDFQVGDSAELLPELIGSLNQSGDALEFVLIDGDHSTSGVRRDIESVLKIVPRKPLYIVMHDSFHPPCREGILEVDWASHPHVHFVEVDFVPGVYFREGTAQIRPGAMYGGFALACLRSEPRGGPLQVGQVHRGLYEVCLADSQSVTAALTAAVNGQPRRSERPLGWESIKRRLRIRTRIRHLLGRVPGRS